MTEPAHLQYRPDVDGLRAVAVICVLLFHAFPAALPGGFAGVDMFFVISGFLISAIILTNLRRGTFSFADFYARRIRRIFPALAAVLFVCVLFGWKVLLPDEFTQLGRHVSAGALFISNLALWDESGYFDAAAETKPLLHLWSLGIEEQYYIFWPLALFASRRWLLRLFWPISFLALASFAVNLALVRRHPEAAYYSPGARGWELLVGSLLAYVSLFRPRMLAPAARYAAAISLLGAALIGTALVFLNPTRDFPGWWALLPTLGATLIIAAGPRAPINRLVLGAQPLVFVGLISYPLYLWHWPVLTFARIVVGELPPWPLRLACLPASFVLATLTWRLIERPIRERAARQFPRTATIGLATCVAAAGLIGALALNEIVRAESAALPTAFEVSKAVNDWEESHEQVIRGTSSEAVLFFGDSHMRQYWPRIRKISTGTRPTRTVIFKTKNGCAPVPGVERRGRDCDDFVADALAAAHAPQVRTVVIGASWYGFVTRTDYFRAGNTGGTPLELAGSDAQWVMAGFEKSVRELVESGKQVVIMLSSPRHDGLDPRHLIYRDGLSWRARDLSAGVPLQTVDAESAQIDSVLRELAGRAGASVIDPSDWLCGPNVCPSVDGTGRPIYIDGSHVRASIMRDQIDALDRYVYSDG